MQRGAKKETGAARSAPSPEKSRIGSERSAIHKVETDTETESQRGFPCSLCSVNLRNLPLQAKSRPNHTGMPDRLKEGIESLSGMDMSDVRVHTNSGKPAQLNALAYAQGSDIHLSPGQERHLPHEAWHVVQQRQGRVRPIQFINRLLISGRDNSENKVNVAGAKLFQNYPQSRINFNSINNKMNDHVRYAQTGSNAIQFAISKKKKDLLKYIAQSKGKLLHKRSPTTYYYFNKKRRKIQGPHTSSHITTSVFLEPLLRSKANLTHLLNTKLIPRPRIVNHLLRLGFASKGAQPQSAKLKADKRRYLMQYQRLYSRAKKGGSSLFHVANLKIS